MTAAPFALAGGDFAAQSLNLPNTTGTTGRLNASHTRTFISGVYGGNVGGTGTTVFVNSNGQLGTTTSSRRFKDDVQDMGPASNIVFKLRPVSFTYKPEYGGNPTELHVGLIAEEVAQLAPWMVVYDRDGQPYTVRYETLAPMLLNEAQKQQRAMDELRKENAELAERLATIEHALRANAGPARPDVTGIRMVSLVVGGLGAVGLVFRRRQR